MYDASITSVSHDDGVAGDLAVIFDGNRKFIAIGLYDPASPIRIRVLHHGAPRGIDAAFWHETLTAALDRRRSLAESADTTGYRCVHGENDGLPGLVVDRYDDTYVVKIDTAAWLPHLDDVVDALASLVEPDAVVLRGSRHVRLGDREGSALLGDLPSEPVLFAEAGLLFAADVVRGQKTGHFLDQRDNRMRVGEIARGARMLDVFACTGGFSVHAAAGGAREVLSVDQSAPALAMAASNMALNTDRPAVAVAHHTVEVGDAFEVMDALAKRGRRFDIVVVDPPSFAPRQANVPAALHAYARLTSFAVRLVEPGGTLVQASCSSRISAVELRATVARAAAAAGHPLTVVASTGHPIDHPIGFPEGAYLKALFATVDA